MREGGNREYKEDPKTADATSNPEPTFPCALQCAICDRLWILDLLDSVNSSAAAAAGEKNRNREAHSDVMRAAELPSPVFDVSVIDFELFENRAVAEDEYDEEEGEEDGGME